MSTIQKSDRPVIVGIGGFTSEVGKTSLLCELLRFFPGWEAIKTTRGHYRSCGKDPHTCCVSHLLSEEPVIKSGYDATYTTGKDTGRYWEAGAANVHWLIGTDSQIDEGTRQAIERVTGPGVFIEGNSFTEFVPPDFFIMVVRPDTLKIKATAKRALSRASAVYVSGADAVTDLDRQKVQSFLMKVRPQKDFKIMPVFDHSSLSQLVSRLGEVDRKVAA